MNHFLVPVLLVFSLILSACSSVVERIPGIYTIDIQQGNIINQAVVDQLRPNMNKRQVLYILGTPMLRDVFHQKRWDYIFSEQLGGGTRVQKRLTLYFEGDTLMGMQGDFRPSVVPELKPSDEVSIDIPKRTLKKTMSEKIVDLFDFEISEPPITTDPADDEELVEAEPGIEGEE